MAREGQIFTKHAVLIIFIQKILQSADSRAISGPKLLFEGCGVASGVFSRQKTRFSGNSDMYLEKKSAPGRLSRPRDPSRSTRAAILADKGVLGVSNR